MKDDGHTEGQPEWTDELAILGAVGGGTFAGQKVDGAAFQGPSLRQSPPKSQMVIVHEDKSYVLLHGVLLSLSNAG